MAIDAHKDACLSSEEPKESLTDLLADIRHWCVANKVSFGLALELSRQHFNAEHDEITDTTLDRGPVTETLAEPGVTDTEDSGAADLDPTSLDSPQAGN